MPPDPAVTTAVRTTPESGRRKYRRIPAPSGAAVSGTVVAGRPVGKGPSSGAPRAVWVQARTVLLVVAYTWRRPAASVAVTGSLCRSSPPRRCQGPNAPSGCWARARRVRWESRTYTVRSPSGETEADGVLIAEVPSSSAVSGVPSDCHGPNGPPGADWTAYTTSRRYSAAVAPNVVRVARTAMRPSGMRAVVAPGSMPVPGSRAGPVHRPPAWPSRAQTAICPSRAAKAHSRPGVPAASQEALSPRA